MLMLVKEPYVGHAKYASVAAAAAGTAAAGGTTFRSRLWDTAKYLGQSTTGTLRFGKTLLKPIYHAAKPIGTFGAKAVGQMAKTVGTGLYRDPKTWIPVGLAAGAATHRLYNQLITNKALQSVPHRYF